MDDKIHPSLDTAEIMAEVAFQHPNPITADKDMEEEEEEKPIVITRAEVLQSLELVHKLEALFPDLHISCQHASLLFTSPQVQQVLPARQQRTLDKFFVK